MILAIIGCLIGLALLWIGRAIILWNKENIPPTRWEIDRLKDEASEAKDESERALRFMRVADAEAERLEGGKPKLTGWIIVTIGFIFIAVSVLWILR